MEKSQITKGKVEVTFPSFNGQLGTAWHRGVGGNYKEALKNAYSSYLEYEDEISEEYNMYSELRDEDWEEIQKVLSI